jgi:hypothetical protein
MIPKIQKITEVTIQSILDWHKEEKPSNNPYPENEFLYLIYKKNQIDTIQWHIEDEIRRPDLPAEELVKFKREIDKLNQDRTDTVELLDDTLFLIFKDIKKEENARMNSETPAWLLDRMSILELKIYHMEEQANRKDAETSHISKCKEKLNILLEQRKDLQKCFDDLTDDLYNGRKFMKVYRQMKMYNDEKLNPSLYNKNKIS